MTKDYEIDVPFRIATKRIVAHVSGIDGTISIDHDFEYDIAMMEFGEPKSEEMRLVEAWKKDPIELLLWSSELFWTDWSIGYIIIDFSEHVFKQMLDKKIVKLPTQDIEILWSAIRSSRKLMRTKGERHKSEKLRRDHYWKLETMVKALYSVYGQYNPDTYMVASVQSMIESISSLGHDHPKFRREGEHTYEFAQETSGHTAPCDPDSNKSEKGKIKERNWQIRRIFDCAKSAHRPRLEDTK